MTNDISRINPNALYELRHAADLLGVSKQSLSAYTRDQKIRASIRRSNGRRCWKGSELIRFWKTIY